MLIISLFVLDILLHTIGYGWLYISGIVHFIDALLMIAYLALNVISSKYA